VIEDVTRASDASHRVTLQATVALQHARSARRFGDEDGAAALLDQTRLLYLAPDAMLRQVLAEEAVAQALRFDPDRAASLLDALEQARPATRVLRARLALLDHDQQAASTLLSDLPPPATRREAVERGVLCALSVLQIDVEAANRHLHDALAASQPERLVRTIIDLGPDLDQVLRSYAPDPSQEAYLDELLAAAGRVVAPVRTQVSTTLVEPLSDREVTVLRYLCSRLTYQEIATALYVSLNTLKSHVRSVYRKLGVASRSEAVAVGRSHALI
jgi:LuxR family maltose regulon positive regulatory protein